MSGDGEDQEGEGGDADVCGLAISWCQFLQKSKQSAVLRSAPASSALGKTSPTSDPTRRGRVHLLLS